MTYKRIKKRTHLFVPQPARLDGHTKLNISAKVYLYQRTVQYLESYPFYMQEQMKIPLLFRRTLFTRFQNLNT